MTSALFYDHAFFFLQLLFSFHPFLLNFREKYVTTQKKSGDLIKDSTPRYVYH